MPRSLKKLLDLDSMGGAVVAYALLGLLLCFFRLDAGGVLVTEGMVAEAGRNMAESGDWLVPWMYGEPYTYKPPMAYWAAAWAHTVSEGRPSETALRLPFAAAAWSMGLITVLLIGRRAGPLAGLMAGLAAIGSGVFIQKTHTANFDVLLAAAMGVAFAAACANLTLERSRTWAWLVVYLALAAAFLTKGAIALMVFGPGLLVAASLAGRLDWLTGKGHLMALGLLAAVALGYLWLLGRTLGPTGFEQPLEEAQRRALTWTAEAAGRTLTKPFLILGSLLPWSLLLPHAVSFAKSSPAAGDAASQRLLRVSLAFLAAGIVAYMLVPTHHMRYYLPLSVPAGIAAGVTVARLRELGAPPTLVRLARLLALSLAVVLLAVAVAAVDSSGADRLLLGCASLAVGGLVVSARRLSTGPVAALLLASSMAFLVLQGVVLKPRHAAKRSLDELAATLEPLVPTGETIWVRGPADYAGKHASLFFYLDRPVRAFRSPEEVPAGSYYLFREDLMPEASQTDMAFEVVAAFAEVRHTYKLARRLAAAEVLASSARSTPGSAPGW